MERNPENPQLIVWRSGSTLVVSSRVQQNHLNEVTWTETLNLYTLHHSVLLPQTLNPKP